MKTQKVVFHLIIFLNNQMAIPTEWLTTCAFFISLIGPLSFRLSVTSPPTCLPSPACGRPTALGTDSRPRPAAPSPSSSSPPPPLLPRYSFWFMLLLIPALYLPPPQFQHSLSWTSATRFRISVLCPYTSLHVF